MRTIDTEHSWFWKEGHKDGFKGARAVVPDKARLQHQRSDYFAGHRAGEEARIAKAEAEDDDAADFDSLVSTAAEPAPSIDLGRAKDLLADAMGQVQAMMVRKQLGSHNLDETLRELFTVLDK